MRLAKSQFWGLGNALGLGRSKKQTALLFFLADASVGKDNFIQSALIMS